MTNRMIENCKKLCAVPGTPGGEAKAAELAASLLREFIPDSRTDGFGSAIGLLPSKKEGAKTLLLDAHIDEIGLIITSIDDKGFLKFDKCGGVDRRLMAAQRVVIHGVRDIPGIIGSKPPHLEKEDDAKKAPDFPELFIDIGYSKEEAEKLVSPGDRATFDVPFLELPNGRISCKALDDRCSVAAILEALALLQGEDLPVNLAVQFSGREETGGQGALISAYRFEPDAALTVDVSFAQIPGIEEHQSGKLGEGVMIGYAAALDMRLADSLVTLAKNAGIPYQIEAMGGRGTGTNNDEIVIARGGVRGGCLSIPQRYMHMPVEIVQVSDIEATARLIAEFVKNAGGLI